MTLPVIISASRRTDIPQYYGKWFAERVKEGFAEFRNAFGGFGRASLKQENVLGYLFWTKYAGRFHDQLLAFRNNGMPYVFQYTVNGYGHDVEGNIPSLGKVLDDFHRVVQGLPDGSAIQWRYDPVILSEEFSAAYHVGRFREIAAHLKGATRVANTSIIEPYDKTIRRLKPIVPTGRFRPNPERQEKLNKRYPTLPLIDKHLTAELLIELQAIAAEYGIELRSCSNPELDFLAKAQCCGPELFSGYSNTIQGNAQSLIPGPSRAGCQCVKTVDIGMDNTCLGGCLYCYVVNSHKTAIKNFAKHQPSLPALR